MRCSWHATPRAKFMIKIILLLHHTNESDNCIMIWHHTIASYWHHPYKCTWKSAFVKVYLINGIWYMVFDSWYLIHGIWYMVLDACHSTGVKKSYFGHVSWWVGSWKVTLVSVFVHFQRSKSLTIINQEDQKRNVGFPEI